METTLVLVKPDGVSRCLIGEVAKRVEARGLQIVGLKLRCGPAVGRGALCRTQGEAILPAFAIASLAPTLTRAEFRAGDAP